MLITITFLLFGQPFFMGWFISPTYSAFFIAGIAFYLLWREGPSLYNVSILALSFVTASVYAYQQTADFIPEPSRDAQVVAMIVVWSFFALFTLLVAGKLNFRKSSTLMILGGLTYPLYLIHNRAGNGHHRPLLGYLSRNTRCDNDHPPDTARLVTDSPLWGKEARNSAEGASVQNRGARAAKNSS